MLTFDRLFRYVVTAVMSIQTLLQIWRKLQILHTALSISMEKEAIANDGGTWLALEWILSASR